jgi:hypothetical protein
MPCKAATSGRGLPARYNLFNTLTDSIMRALCFSLCLTAAILPALALSAADPPKPGSKTAVTDPALADADYPLQGEYAGAAYGSGPGAERVGLQVIALGDGKFDAVYYRGGLPGAGWDQRTRGKLSGAAVDGKLTLTRDSGQIVVAGGTAIVQDTAGRELGRLAKIERRSPTMGLAPAAGATVLFDGGSTDNLQGAKVTPDGLLSAGVLTKMPVGAFYLHLEFRTPYMPYARGQARGNSGVYIQQRYEVQILDSFGLEGVENECGGLYRQTRPDLNMCLPPLAWQTYDIWFTPPRFAGDGKTKIANAEITVLHNGVPIHSRRQITAKTGGGKQEAPEPFPINLQDHGNPVTFRNIWIVLGGGERYSVSSRDLEINYATAPAGDSCCPKRCCRGLLRRHRRCR